MSYPRLKGTLANCVVWNSQLNFYLAEVFFLQMTKREQYAENSKKVEPLERLLSSNCFSVDQFYCIRKLGELTVADTSYFGVKCGLLSREKTFLTRFVSKGSKHN